MHLDGFNHFLEKAENCRQLCDLQVLPSLSRTSYATAPILHHILIGPLTSHMLSTFQLYPEESRPWQRDLGKPSAGMPQFLCFSDSHFSPSQSTIKTKHKQLRHGTFKVKRVGGNTEKNSDAAPNVCDAGKRQSWRMFNARLW